MKNQDTNFFPGQQAGEKICLVIRQHWVILAMKLLTLFFFLVVMAVIDYFASPYVAANFDPSLSNLLTIVRICFLMFISLGALIILVMYHLNVQVITNERIVDISYKGLLHYTVSELHLNQIEDVTAEVHGLVENVFDFGNVYIQTAGETERFVFHHAPGPAKITKAIMDSYEELTKHPIPVHPTTTKPA